MYTQYFSVLSTVTIVFWFEFFLFCYLLYFISLSNITFVNHGLFIYEDAQESNSVSITQHQHISQIPYENGEFGQDLPYIFPGIEIEQKDVEGNVTGSGENNRHYPPPAFHHLCENFAFPPPPPPNRKRVGPRRKFEIFFYLYFFHCRTTDPFM